MNWNQSGHLALHEFNQQIMSENWENDDDAEVKVGQCKKDVRQG